LLSEAFLDFALEVLTGACDAILVHVHSPIDTGQRRVKWGVAAEQAELTLRSCQIEKPQPGD
jgi:hypothetical protein